MGEHGGEAEGDQRQQGDHPGGLGDLPQAERRQVIGNDRRQTGLGGDRVEPDAAERAVTRLDRSDVDAGLGRRIDGSLRDRRIDRGVAVGSIRSAHIGIHNLAVHAHQGSRHHGLHHRVVARRRCQLRGDISSRHRLDRLLDRLFDDVRSEP